MVSAILRGSLKGYPASLSIVRFSYFPKSHAILLCVALFCYSRLCFLRLPFSSGTIIAALISQGVIGLKIEVKWEFILTHYHCHGRGSMTWSDSLELYALQMLTATKNWSFLLFELDCLVQTLFLNEFFFSSSSTSEVWVMPWYQLFAIENNYLDLSSLKRVPDIKPTGLQAEL